MSYGSWNIWDGYIFVISMSLIYVDVTGGSGTGQRGEAISVSGDLRLYAADAELPISPEKAKIIMHGE